MNYVEFLEGLTEIEKPLIKQYQDILEEVNPSRVLEIGSGWGLFSRVVLEKTRASLVTIDKIENLPDFDKRTEGFEKRMQVIKGDSKEMVQHLNEKFDLIFIDGDHGFSGVAHDLENAWEKLKDDGTLLLDDVFHKNNWKITEKDVFDYGVTRAIWAFLKTEQFNFAMIYPVAHGLVRIDR